MQRGKGKVLVTVSLLVSNRKDTIRKCMESIKPLLRAVPSELIAVDTVGEENSDGSLEIVREYADKIVHFDWCNDFAAARNAGLKEATGEWFLYLDDDEWFENITPIILFFQKGDYKKYDGARYVVRNYKNREGTEYVDGFADRMCKIRLETHFEGRVHECLMPPASKVMQFFCFAHHYGYVYENEEKKKKHIERNTILLEQELQEYGDNPRMAAQLVQEYAVAGRMKEAETLCYRSLERYSSMLLNPFVQYFVAMLFRITARQEDKNIAVLRLNEIEATYPLCELPRLIYLTESIMVESQREDYFRVINLVKEWLKQREKIESLGDKILVQEIFDFGTYLSLEGEIAIIQEGIYAILQTGEYSMAQRLFERVPWSDEKQIPFQEMLWLIEVYGRTGDTELFFSYAEKLMEHSKMKKPFLSALQDMIRQYPERREELSTWLRKFETKKQNKADNLELQKLAEQLKQNIRALLEAGNQEEARNLILGLKEIMPEDEEIKKLEKMFI